LAQKLASASSPTVVLQLSLGCASITSPSSSHGAVHVCIPCTSAGYDCRTAREFGDAVRATSGQCTCVLLQHRSVGQTPGVKLLTGLWLGHGALAGVVAVHAQVPARFAAHGERVSPAVETAAQRRLDRVRSLLKSFDEFDSPLRLLAFAPSGGRRLRLRWRLSQHPLPRQTQDVGRICRRACGVGLEASSHRGARTPRDRCEREERGGPREEESKHT